MQQGSELQPKYSKAVPPKDEDDDGMEEEDEEEHGETLCGACGENYAGDEFWICCDISATREHGLDDGCSAALPVNSGIMDCYNPLPGDVPKLRIIFFLPLEGKVAVCLNPNSGFTMHLQSLCYTC
ncbi:hypothetical protein V6N12_056838 [Hibiscus sabdariffa]|uniref:PHD finger protein ALFIN-LIKE n=1 Tax=Hibiscus sabdariffa TaxID=183260 RepID=A0ABR2DCJ7_9ROSI